MLKDVEVVIAQAASYKAGKCQMTIGALKMIAAASGRVTTRASAMTQRGRSNGRTTHAGVPYSNSGGNTSVSNRCCAM